ncbi:Acetyltransferase [Heterostelium album PN500]|uniref:Acetyltransferase n=1 Tax=Heterostelium pallidum (strain ATCC 26659 / Pp 5 / PN500) TaxID=670386 RepID=D3BEG4_HETP5|nr:Acetyltransferase [Heterostelium album PN500]EFA80295.1 Acetyltransferase [Heterostelium album PN500]|eukprot:XP_020432415.1 Acetyltransferase [Heterostelium album PN500]
MDRKETEKEKMISSKLYFSGDAELTQDRLNAKEICYDFNLLRPSLREERANLIKKLFGKTGKDICIESPFHCDYGYNIEVGNGFYTNHGCCFLDVAPIKIGENCMFGPNVGLYCAGHPIDVATRNSYLEYGYPITIGDNVWIGGNVTVLPGVTIGDNTIIGGGSVVTKSIPSNCIAVGNPCRVLREITEEDKNKYKQENPK